MPTDAQPEPGAPKPTRRWFQFGLRTMLGLIAAVSIGLAVVVTPAARQRRAVAAVRGLGGVVHYAYEGPQPWQDTGVLIPLDPDSDSRPNRPWFRRLFGEDYFRAVHFVDFSPTLIGDSGLASVEGISHLEKLKLEGTQVSDAGLDHLKKLSRIKGLDLSKTQITDAGLARLVGLTRLEWLKLEDTQVTDAGLVHLKGLTQLEWLDLAQTRVTDEGMAELSEALPNCKIVGLEPAADLFRSEGGP